MQALGVGAQIILGTGTVVEAVPTDGNTGTSVTLSAAGDVQMTGAQINSTGQSGAVLITSSGGAISMLAGSSTTAQGATDISGGGTASVTLTADGAVTVDSSSVAAAAGSGTLGGGNGGDATVSIVRLTAR
jgi:hypothetical protein